jgi:adenine-specific DNA-methyltransferase
MGKKAESISTMVASLNEHELRRLLINHLTNQKLGLVWENNSLERDKAINDSVVLPQLCEDLSCRSTPGSDAPYGNLIIEGDNFDSLRLLKSTHANKIRVIYIDPPYNTGNKDWVYNDNFVGQNDRWRHSQWLEFLYRRLEIARDLLTPDGVILVSIDDENRSKLELLLDEVFPGGRIGSFVWRVRSGGNDTKGALLSANHEHILVYGNDVFSFKGDGRDETSYSNPDNDPRGEWGNDNLVKAHNAKQRPEAFYSICNPESETWYPCDIDSVWRFSSTSRPLRKKLQADPIEKIIEEKRILWPANERVACYATLAALNRSIKSGEAPKQLRVYLQIKELQRLAQTDQKVARLLTYIEPIENWVGRKIGYGKPRYKRFRSQLKRDVTPLSSWLNPAADGDFDDEEDSEVTLTVGATGEGTNLYKKILGNKDFPYPKPLSLLTGLLAQSTRKDDIILDFFAGSGTTAHAVLALNAQDEGSRRFIMCSSTESTKAEPNRNICKDVCAARIRKIITDESYGLAGDFAYLQLTKIAPEDVRMDSTPEHAFNLLNLRTSLSVRPYPESAAKVVFSNDEMAVVYLPEVNEKSIKALLALPQRRLAVYSARPQTVAEKLDTSGKEGNSYAIGDVLLAGQAGNAVVRSAL